MSVLMTATLSAIAMLSVAGYFALCNGALPKKSHFSIDFDKVRKLAEANVHELPKRINMLPIAYGALPSWAAVAGDFKSKKTAIDFTSFQIVYEDKTAILEIPFNNKLFKRFPYGTRFIQENYDIMQGAMLDADFIFCTHEHWDHIGGAAQSKNIEQIIDKCVFTYEQVTGPTIADSEFPEGILDSYKPLVYHQYHRIAPGIVLIKAPGHSVGHQFAFVKLANGKELLFTGDVSYVMKNFDKQKNKPWLVSKKRFENRKQISNQLRYLHNVFYVEKAPNFHIVSTHDPEQHRQYIKENLIKEGFEQSELQKYTSQQIAISK